MTDREKEDIAKLIKKGKGRAKGAAGEVGKALAPLGELVAGALVGAVAQVVMVASGTKQSTADWGTALVGGAGTVAGAIGKKPGLSRFAAGFAASGVTHIITRKAIAAVNKAAENLNNEDGTEVAPADTNAPADGGARQAALPYDARADDVIARARAQANGPEAGFLRVAR